MLYPTRYLLLALVLLCGISNAQEKASKHTCRILFLERPSDAPTELFLFDGVKSQQVELPSMNLSPVYELAAGPLNLTLLPTPPQDPEKLTPGAPSTKVPEAMVDFYLLIISDPTNKVAPVRMQVVNASSEKITKGQTLWFNLTDLTIGGKLGTEKLLINPKGSIVTNAPRNDAGDYPVSIAYHKQGEETSYPICETIWMYDPLSRSLGFIIQQAGAKNPRLMMYPDFRSEPKKPEPEAQAPNP